MPLYEYACGSCGARFERIRKFSDPPVTTCPECGGTVEKLISSPAFHLKGSGWYITDYARSGQKDGGKEAGKDGAGKAEGGKDAVKDSSDKATSDKGASEKSGSGKDSATGTSSDSSASPKSDAKSESSAAKPAASDSKK